MVAAIVSIIGLKKLKITRSKRKEESAELRFVLKIASVMHSFSDASIQPK
jgi:hypothetical protein